MEKLEPIDHKYIKKPDEYDGSGFHLWFKRFKDLLVNLNKTWNMVLKFLEDASKDSLKINHQEFAMKIGETLGEQGREQFQLGEQFAHQLKIYLRSYSKGPLYDAVVKCKAEDVFELMRSTIKKLINRNYYRMVAMKTEILSPPRAKDMKQLEQI